jgi:hypothetical protein
VRKVGNEQGVRITYQGNVLNCSTYRSKQENMDACVQALCLLLDKTQEQIFMEPMYPDRKPEFQEFGGVIELFSSR